MFWKSCYLLEESFCQIMKLYQAIVLRRSFDYRSEKYFPSTYFISLEGCPSYFIWGPTFLHFLASCTMAPASINPNPKEWLTIKPIKVPYQTSSNWWKYFFPSMIRRNLDLPFLPAPFVFQSKAFKGFGLAVATTMCCTSRHVSSVFASKVNATIPAAKGADADVPLWLLVHS